MQPPCEARCKLLTKRRWQVLSPEDRQSDVLTKVEQYLMRGVALVVVIDPVAQTAATSRRSALSATLHGVELLDLDEVVPGFRCRVEEIFLQKGPVFFLYSWTIGICPDRR